MIARLICKLLHAGVMYAGGDTYRCRTCLREWPVPWAREQGARLKSEALVEAADV